MTYWSVWPWRVGYGKGGAIFFFFFWFPHFLRQLPEAPVGLPRSLPFGWKRDKDGGFTTTPATFFERVCQPAQPRSSVVVSVS